ncbi:polymorphic toxin type 46 domain-containing protein [Microbulbifer sp. ZKSA006]|uniref:polymorphic toxin type 46 domain-containing protein n=1 Tax=Microbulbifer sp. ZKSA006 TaxID=3243390 RepID=UPI004039C71F
MRSMAGRTGDLHTGINVRGRQETAFNFYKSQGFDEVDIPSHLSGIDFTQPVDIVTINSGKQLFQFQTRGAPQGNYYSLSADTLPTELGINPDGFNRALQVVEPKIQTPYRTTQKVDVLKINISGHP